MELNEALRRIFVQHWLLIVVAVGLGVAAGATKTFQGTSFTATTRLVLDAPDPRTSAESIAIADTARAIATSPGQVRNALAGEATAGRDPVELAKNHIAVSALGTSGVIQLSVSDPDARVAAAIANALAHQIIQTRLNVATGRTQQVVAELGRQIGVLNAKINRADPISRTLLLQQRSALQIQQANILAAEATQPKPSIISLARRPVTPDSSPVLPYLILGGILGLVVGFGAAGILELVRPTVVGGDALARELGTQYIGATGRDDLPWRVGSVASTAGLPVVGLIPAGPKITTTDLEAIAATLGNQAPSRPWRVSSKAENAATAAVPAAKAARPRAGRATGPLFLPFFEMIPGEVKGETGILLVAPKSVPKSDLLEINRLLSLIPHPVIGLVTHVPGSGSGERKGQINENAAPARAAVPSGRVA